MDGTKKMAVILNPTRRITWAAQTENQRRVYVYLLERAVNVVQDAESSAVDTSFAQYIMSGNGDMETIALVLANESETIGDKIDDVSDEGLTVSDYNISWAINNLDFFGVLATAWNAAGLIS